MKNKKNIFILLPIVLLVWGSVIYQFFNFSKEVDVQQTTKNDFVIKPIIIKEKDTFSINVNYRDPFLGKMYLAKNGSSSKIKTSKIKKAPKVEEPINWPSILYKGIVSDTKDKKKIFMVIINGKTFLMEKGNVEQDILLKDGDRESIYVKYKGNLNIILLQP